MPTDENRLASSSQRYKAGLLDGFVQITVFLCSIPLFNRLLAPFDLAGLTIVLVATLILSFEAIQVSLWGQTLGHRIYGLKVVDERGLNPSFFRAVQRWVFKLFYGIRTFDAMNQAMSPIALHDQNSGTRVIQLD